MIKILSLDGGGSRGVFHLHFLNALEKKLNKPIRACFDYIGGTSIGGIIALTLTHPLKWLGYRSGFMIQDLIDTQTNEALLDVIFGSTRIYRSAIFRTKYSDRSKVMTQFYEKEFFGSDTFGVGCTCPTMIFSYDTQNIKSKVFKSWNAKHSHYPLSIVAKATSAAPTYFPSVPFQNAAGENENFIDGGLYANHPGSFMCHEALKGKKDEKVMLVSLGTYIPGVGLSCHDIGNAGYLGWITKIFRVQFQSMYRSAEYLGGHDGCAHEDGCDCEGFVGSDEEQGYFDYHDQEDLEYFRFAPNVPDIIDSVNPFFLGRIQNIASHYFTEPTKVVDLLAARLSTTETTIKT